MVRQRYEIVSAASSFDPYNPGTIYTVVDTTTGNWVLRTKSSRKAKQYVKDFNRLDKALGIGGGRLAQKVIRRKRKR